MLVLDNVLTAGQVPNRHSINGQRNEAIDKGKFMVILPGYVTNEVGEENNGEEAKNTRAIDALTEAQPRKQNRGDSGALSFSLLGML